MGGRRQKGNVVTGCFPVCISLHDAPESCCLDFSLRHRICVGDETLAERLRGRLLHGLCLTVSSFSPACLPLHPCAPISPRSHAKVNGRVYLIINRWVCWCLLSSFYLKNVSSYVKPFPALWIESGVLSGRWPQVRSWLHFASQAMLVVMPNGAVQWLWRWSRVFSWCSVFGLGPDFYSPLILLFVQAFPERLTPHWS